MVEKHQRTLQAEETPGRPVCQCRRGKEEVEGAKPQRWGTEHLGPVGTARTLAFAPCGLGEPWNGERQVLQRALWLWWMTD
jgi:hypothetical protein